MWNNLTVDRNYIEQIYLQYFSDYFSLAVLLDIYHTKAKIIKKMNKYHPNFRATKQNLTIISIIQFLSNTK
jgi:hypothetical protein